MRDACTYKPALHDFMTFVARSPDFQPPPSRLASASKLLSDYFSDLPTSLTRATRDVSKNAQARGIVSTCLCRGQIGGVEGGSLLHTLDLLGGNSQAFLGSVVRSWASDVSSDKELEATRTSPNHDHARSLF